MTESHWLSPSIMLLSCRMLSNSRKQFSSSRVLICRHTASRAFGQYSAGVGKQELKFAYEFVLIVEVMADAKTFCRAAARGPGTEAIGAWGGGDGDADFRSSIAQLLSSNCPSDRCPRYRGIDFRFPATFVGAQSRCKHDLRVYRPN